MNWKDSLAGSIDKKCIFVVGPTASGKSAWALEQAQRFNGSVVNIDSVQCYEGLVIGAAAPTETEKKIVPHFLYSYVSAPQEVTAADYVRDFNKLIEKKDLRFPLFITGGTGFYIQALEKGMFDVEPIPADFRTEIENELQNEGAEKLYTELKLKDPDSKIHLNDHFRLVRAIEIIRYTGEIPSKLGQNSIKNKYQFPFEYLKVGFDFEKNIYQDRVSRRTEKMLKDGIVEETRQLMGKGFVNWAPLRSVGYAECVNFLSENRNLDWLSESINHSTMKLIKKQKTWFKRDSAVLWSNQLEKLEQFLS